MFVDGLHFAQQAALFELLVIEYLLEDLLVALPEEALEGLLHDVRLFEVEVEFAVNGDVVEKMLRELEVCLLDVVNQFLNFGLVFVCLKDLFDEGKEELFASCALPFCGEREAVHEDHVVVCQPVSLCP